MRDREQNPLKFEPARRLAAYSPLSVDALLASCRDVLESAEDGDLPWSWRVRLWHAFNREYPTDSLLRRKLLALIVASETLTAFDEVRDRIPERMRDYPRSFLRDAKRLIVGEISEPETTITHFEDDIEHAMALDELGSGVYSIIATYAALPPEIQRQERIYEEYEYARVWDRNYQLTEADDEWTCWETHFWAAIVAGGPPGTRQLNIEGHREFWRHWLVKTVPKVRTSISEVLDLVATRWPDSESAYQDT
jgi:hypothetical protein